MLEAEKEVTTERYFVNLQVALWAKNTGRQFLVAQVSQAYGIVQARINTLLAILLQRNIQ